MKAAGPVFLRLADYARHVAYVSMQKARLLTLADVR
jgi:hypothetical protein